MTDITERLRRVAAELTAIHAEITGQARSQAWKPGPRSQVALEATRAFLSRPEHAGAAQWSDCAHHLIHNHGFGRSAAYEHIHKLQRHGFLGADAVRRNVTLPAPSLDALL
jgi:hypothetical protein